MVSQCYYPDGSESTDVPCNPGALESACCDKLSSCMTNKICDWGGNTFIDGFSFPWGVGSCTEKTWNSSACFNPDNCKRLFDPSPQQHAVMATNVACSLTIVQPHEHKINLCGNDIKGYCCDQDSIMGDCNCTTGEKTFFLNNSISSSTTQSSLFSSQTISLSTGSTSQTGSLTGSISVPTYTSSVPTPDSHTRSSKATKIGVGLGVAIGVLVVAVIVTWVVPLRRANKWKQVENKAIQCTENKAIQCTDPAELDRTSHAQLDSMARAELDSTTHAELA